ncbi:hypothetical protein PILCRDRAFT_84614 [Piloderma croceum F 1598]|uniref:Uncharacterized protein n=1 Tax=Piloderma croceum (strain F 1598) TaxID=765440 RepID=A0A0C3CIZ8_PILCF|nr:hypothetical protein PILCRDRAFT_84614 [Piloderma croceum F 1598]
MWSFWILYLGPVLLLLQFQCQKFYGHFVRLVQLLNLCLQFKLTDDDIEEIRVGFIKWVKDYEDIYYQHNPNRVSACPLTIHALLHIMDSIKANGPVWCYWAFPMEQYCGTLQPAIRSHQFPYASLDQHAVETAQLTQIKIIYNVAEELSLRPPHCKAIAGLYSTPLYPSCVVIPPKGNNWSTPNFISRITGALATHFNIYVKVLRPHLDIAQIEE